MPALGMRTGVYSPCDSYVILKENYQPLLLNIFDLKLVVVNLALVQTIRVGGGHTGTYESRITFTCQKTILRIKYFNLYYYRK